MIAANTIAQLGAPVLRLTASTITDIHSAETHALIEAMQTTLAGTSGVGLAAPQIGVSKRLLIVASRPTARYPNAPLMPPTIMINPRYTALSLQQAKDWEGCLSIPGIRALVPRHTHIRIHYTNTDGDEVDTELHDFVARVFQHEFDHLDGKVYLDRVEDNADIIAESEYFKRIAG